MSLTDDENEIIKHVFHLCVFWLLRSFSFIHGIVS